jgi:hypothetical protein
MSVVRVFARCSGGHYFVGKWCPFDGWSSEETESIASVVLALVDEGKVPSMAALKASGLTPQALARACVVEFHSNEQALEAIEPLSVAIDGRAYLLKDAPSGVK